MHRLLPDCESVATHFTEAVVVGYNTTKFDNVMLDRRKSDIPVQL